MEKNVYSLETIFNGRLFTIPDYQRGYSWEKVHCAELMEDIELLPNGFDHYTGTLVLCPKGNDKEQDIEGNSYLLFDVVDGQQRLTTLTILLLNLQTELGKVANFRTLAEGLEKKYLYAKRLSDQAELYKLTLNRDSKDYFSHNILERSPDVKGATILSHRRLLDAKSFFQTYFEQKALELKDEYPQWLLSTHNKVTQQLKLSSYIVDGPADVGVIFEVMNNRGKKLTELEKVKNYLLYLASKLDLPENNRTELANKINTTWTSILEGFMAANLGSEQENQLLRAHWLMGYDYNKREWDGSKSIKKRFSLKNYKGKNSELSFEIKKYIQSLEDASRVFADAEYPERANAFNSILNPALKMKVKKWSTKLKRTRTLASFRPLLMACRLRFPDDGNKYLELIELLEKFAFRVYNMLGKRADTGQSALFKTSFQFYHAQLDFETALQHIINTLTWYSPSYQFESYFEFNEQDNDWYNLWGPLKYFLYEYEEHLANQQNSHVQLPWESINERPLNDTIEHILPQTPTHKYWKEQFPSIKKIRLFTHDLGNLCLTHNNSTYSNFPFPDKKGKPGDERPCYANSSLFQERELASHRDWNEVNITKRREKLVKWALERWHVDQPTHEESIEEELEEEINGEAEFEQNED